MGLCLLLDLHPLSSRYVFIPPMYAMLIILQQELGAHEPKIKSLSGRRAIGDSLDRLTRVLWH